MPLRVKSFFHHRAHRDHREIFLLQSVISVGTVLSVVIFSCYETIKIWHITFIERVSKKD